MTQESYKTVAIYVHFSATDQNCLLQLADLRRYAGQRFGRCYEYVDEDVSGSRCRPQLEAMMCDAHKRLFDVVLVLKFDRFSRSLKHLIDALEQFRILGVDFISFTDGIDTTNGQLLFDFVAAAAQFEGGRLADRVRAGMDHARATGKRIGRPPAVVDAEKVMELRARGLSLRVIARTLNVPVSRVRRALKRMALGQIG